VLDFHNHLIPDVDDGSESIEASTSAIATMREQGIRNIITTPHLRASMLRIKEAHAEYFERVDSQWSLLASHASTHFPDVRLERGFEILLDIPDPDLSDSRARLAGTKFLLVEFPFASIPPNSAQALFDIRMRGYEPIVAHPERYVDAQKDPEIVAEWIRVGAGLQVNAGSLVGRYGPESNKTAWLFLSRGWANYISSDYHAKGECASKAAADAIRRRGGSEQVELLFTVNPERILAEEMPLPVPALAGRAHSWAGRLRAALRWGPETDG
jgi:protein-tyrosine phosphatase